MSERLTWQQIQEKYPDCWVALTNCNMLYGGIQDADIVAVLADDEVDDFRVKNWGTGYRYRRTTERTGVGVISVQTPENKLYSARGSLSKFANSELFKEEKSAWEKAVVEKNENT